MQEEPLEKLLYELLEEPLEEPVEHLSNELPKDPLQEPPDEPVEDLPHRSLFTVPKLQFNNCNTFFGVSKP